MKEKIEDTVPLLKALADERRLQIINLLSCGKMCVCDLTDNLEISQPNMSHHLKVLKNAGLIKATKRGKWVDYELDNERIKELQKNLDFMVTKQPHQPDLEKSNC
ncbi:putative transcriptional regulator [Halobacteroides halobius DSM 5150]|uniref:Putative transcriptional regulator n=1 Tax=Halobacteroides halobius (strain ATCC 35273 / DSM 5150 / MD-1) TaxID=748449 RepID=L0KC09_HALHC|nr:metalloregulator ArsR/SmtB family transcription factor [Halobacteroides halobius]AGB42090.1 putative transcriptional regulator [Halobacteroides halobius DSM 5150]